MAKHAKQPTAHPWRPMKIMMALWLVVICLGTNTELSAEAKKKGVGKTEAEIQKGLEPINKTLDPLIQKVQARSLLSPEEAGKLADLKFQLLDLLDQFPKNALLAKPLYQAALLLSLREEYQDAYELFGALSGDFSGTPYGMRAKGQIQQLEKRLGPDFFASASTTGGASPGKDKGK